MPDYSHPKVWLLTRDDGSHFYVHNLREWADQNGYAIKSIYRLQGFKIKRHKDLINAQSITRLQYEAHTASNQLSN